jgi:hypothetical protein
MLFSRVMRRRFDGLTVIEKNGFAHRIWRGGNDQSHGAVMNLRDVLGL